jgi:hypothetical protein
VLFASDAIAMKLGIEKSAMIRIRAGISYALTEAMNEGHCGSSCPERQLSSCAEIAARTNAGVGAGRIIRSDSETYMFVGGGRKRVEARYQYLERRQVGVPFCSPGRIDTNPQQRASLPRYVLIDMKMPYAE